MLSQRTPVQFPATIWWLSTTCASGSRGSGALIQTYMNVKCQHTYKYLKLKMNKSRQALTMGLSNRAEHRALWRLQSLCSSGCSWVPWVPSWNSVAQREGTAFVIKDTRFWKGPFLFGKHGSTVQDSLTHGKVWFPQTWFPLCSRLTRCCAEGLRDKAIGSVPWRNR